MRQAQLKQRACRRVGMESLLIDFPEQVATAEVLGRIDLLNDDPAVDGVFLQHPLPRHIDERACFDRIAVEKDVGGDSSLSFGRLATENTFAAATPAAIMRLLSYYGLSVETKRAVVVGRSAMVGKPMAVLLLNANATVTLCHSRTRDLPEIVHRGEVVVAAVGKPELVKGSWIRDGAVVIDAGYHPLPPLPAGAGPGTGGAGSAVGDVELRAVTGRCAAYTPVPGGIGPMTVAVLLANTVAAAETSAGAVRTGPPRGRPR
jgi:methylenetetrahydrofolate dehydrogenase (NADP+)/methenyltetrahydrofolate cyclohydrolase